MKKPNKYLTIFFILAIVYALYSMVPSSSKKKTPSKPSEAPEYPTGELDLGDTFKEKSGSAKMSYKKEKQKMLPWGTDPFIFPEGMDPYHKMKKRDPKKVVKGPVTGINTGGQWRHKLLSLKITSILISEDQKVATLDQAPYVVTIGDWIGNVEVLDIMSDRVIFGRQGKIQEVFLK